MEKQTGIFILLGTNLGEKAQNINKAIQLIEERIGLIISKSSLYETQAWGLTDQPSFYNQVIQVDSTLNPLKMLEEINKIEALMGRTRFIKWGERIIDIDILYYHQQIIDLPNLQIPHPGIPDRRFTLIPLEEIASELIHPILFKTQKELLDECRDDLTAKIIKKN